MSEPTTTTTADSADTTPGAAVAEPDFFAKILAFFQSPKKTGVHCEYCDWTGPAGDVVKAPRLNEDGRVYQINACPRCMRNGGLEFYD